MTIKLLVVIVVKLIKRSGIFLENQCICQIATGEPNFLTLDAKKTFNHLRLAFIKAPILQYFDLKSHIRIETDASSYAISEVLSQSNFDSNVSPNNSNKSDFD